MAPSSRGAITATLILTQVQPAAAGRDAVTVTNHFDTFNPETNALQPGHMLVTVSSDPVGLTVNTPGELGR